MNKLFHYIFLSAHKKLYKTRNKKKKKKQTPGIQAHVR